MASGRRRPMESIVVHIPGPDANPPLVSGVGARTLDLRNTGRTPMQLRHGDLELKIGLKSHFESLTQIKQRLCAPTAPLL